VVHDRGTGTGAGCPLGRGQIGRADLTTVGYSARPSLLTARTCRPRPASSCTIALPTPPPAPNTAQVTITANEPIRVRARSSLSRSATTFGGHSRTLAPTRSHPAACAYLERKRAEGKSRREAIRCLKRLLARVVFNTVKASLALDIGATLARAGRLAPRVCRRGVGPLSPWRGWPRRLLGARPGSADRQLLTSLCAGARPDVPGCWRCVQRRQPALPEAVQRS
jgi:hypothetical protein